MSEGVFEGAIKDVLVDVDGCQMMCLEDVLKVG